MEIGMKWGAVTHDYMTLAPLTHTPLGMKLVRENRVY